MRTHRIRLRYLSAILLMGAALGCGAGDRSFDEVTSALPSDTARPTEWEDSESAGAAPTEFDDFETDMPSGDEMPMLANTDELEIVELTPIIEAFDHSPGVGFDSAAGGATGRPRSMSVTPPRTAPVPTPVSEVDEIVRNLLQGNIVYNAPEIMQFDEPTDLELLLSPSQSVEELVPLLRNTTRTESSEVKTGNRMEALLTGSGFAIESLSPALQAVTSTQPTRWRWRVTPKKHGPQELNLSLLAHIDVAGKDAPLVIETKDAVIQVDITLGQRLASFLQPNWQWLWGTIVLPIFGYRMRRRRPHAHHEPRREAA